MNSAILQLIHVQNLIPFSVCHIVHPETALKDLMQVIMLMVTDDKGKILVSHSVTHHAIEDVKRF